MRRRDVLALGLSGLAGLLVRPGLSLADYVKQGWLTGYGTSEGRYGLARIDPDLTATPLLTSDFRLHDVLHHPMRFELCAPARRPGPDFWVLNEAGEAQRLSPGEGRHCFGHGAYSPDGKILYLPENDYDGERGVIGVYDVDDGYRKQAEYPSQGIGPHEIQLTADGKHLVVANGGILTHPETGRAKLNLDSMAPNLALIEAASGRALEGASLPDNWHQLSIRHIDVSSAGTVAFGLQDQVRTGEPRPMVGLWRPGSAPVMLAEPEGSWHVLKSYVGSVAFDTSARYLAATSPKSGRALFWTAKDGSLAGNIRLSDVCGIAATPQPSRFLLTTGDGTLAMVSLLGDRAEIIKQGQSNLRFDNHCSLMTT